MKIRNHDIRQDRKLRKQVNHLSGFIGMPMWNGSNPSLSEIREYDRRLLEKQALGLMPQRKGLMKALLRGVINTTSKAFVTNTKIKKTPKAFKYEISKPMNTSSECCS